MKMKPWQMTRRTLLRAAGISVALPTLDAMLDGKGRWLRKAGAATPAPVRVMAFHFPHGVDYQLTTVKGNGRGSPRLVEQPIHGGNRRQRHADRK